MTQMAADKKNRQEIKNQIPPAPSVGFNRCGGKSNEVSSLFLLHLRPSASSAEKLN
jgi:hypothetical protein